MQVLDPLHCLHAARFPCTQMPVPLQYLHVTRWFPCSQMPVPLQSLHAALLLVLADAVALTVFACRPLLPVLADAGALAVFALILVPPMNTPGMDALALVDGCARLASADDVAIDVDGLFARERR